MNRELKVFITIGFFILATVITTESLIIFELSKQISLSFADEDVIVTINGMIANVYARYGLKNYGEDLSYWLILPFTSKPWDINLTFGGKQLKYTWTTSKVKPEPICFDAIIFRIDIAYEEKGDILVSYKRLYEITETNGKEIGVFKYIVGTTRSWGKPLNFAHFELWMQENDTKILLETRDYTNWLPNETFLIFEFEIH